MQKHSFEHRQKASQLPFLLFLRESIDKFRKRVHNKFGKMNMAYRNMACALCAGTEEWGENPRRRNGTVNVGKEAFGAKAQPLAKKAGKAKATRAAIRHRAQSQDIRFLFFLAAFPPERMQVHKNVCTKV